jgi:hypothetical protein
MVEEAKREPPATVVLSINFSGCCLALAKRETNDNKKPQGDEEAA